MADEMAVLERDPRSTQADDEHDVHGSKWHGAVLLADEIDYYCRQNPPMVSPFEPSRLRPASYQLTLGKEAHIGGKPVQLDESRPTILEPHQVAVVSTREVVRMPRFLIGRWSLRVRNIYEGLLWTGGPQVDPGWAGQLFCPIYNLAERAIELRAGQPLFTIDFTRTTPLTKSYKGLTKTLPDTWFLPKKKTLDEHDQYQIHSAPYEALRSLEDVKHEARDSRRSANAVIAVMFAAIGATVAALGVVAVRPSVEAGGKLLDFWPMTALVSAGFATALSVFSVFLSWKGMSNKVRDTGR